MGTRHNVVFQPCEYTNEETKKRINEIKFNKDNTLNLNCVKNSNKIYVHWDGYPSGALPVLKDFLNSDGARNRMCDTEYLSAYYVAWKIIHDFGHTNLKELDDYRSIGLENNFNDWCDYTYIIQPQSVDASYKKFVIYVLDYKLRLIEKIENINNLEKYENEKWWY